LARCSGLPGHELSADEAIAELVRCAGRQFDADVVTAFRAELAAPAAGHRRERAAAPADDLALSVTAG
jgi:HD-GYP domain-containing protein (c-di-GMP phosphodiesterase class II)